MRFHWPIIGKGRKDQLQDAAGAADLGDRNSGAERRHQSIRKLAGRFGGVVLQPTLKLNDDMAEPALIPEFSRRFRNLDLRKETKRGTSVYNGIFNLLVLQGARELFDNRRFAGATDGEVADRDLPARSKIDRAPDRSIGLSRRDVAIDGV